MKTRTLTNLFIMAGLLLAGCTGKAPTPQSKNATMPIMRRTATPAPPPSTSTPTPFSQVAFRQPSQDQNLHSPNHHGQ